MVDVQNLVRLCKCKEMRKIRKIVAIILSISITFPPLFSTTCRVHLLLTFEEKTIKIWISTWLRDLQSLSLSLCLILTNLRFFPQTQIPWTSSAPHPQLLLLLNPEEKQVKGIRFNAFLLQLISGKKSLPPSPWQTLLCPPSPERGQLLRSDDIICFCSSSSSHPPMTQVLLLPPQKNSVDTGRVRSQLGPGAVRPPKHFPPQLTSTNKKVAQNFHSTIISTLIHSSS